MGFADQQTNECMIEWNRKPAFATEDQKESFASLPAHAHLYLSYFELCFSSIHGQWTISTRLEVTDKLVTGI